MTKECSRRSLLKKVTNYATSLAIAAILAGCATTIGYENIKLRDSMNFGPKQKIRFCIYRTPGISDKKIKKFMKVINKEYAPFKLEATVERIETFKRKGETLKGTFDEIILDGVEIKPPCDRNFYIVNRTKYENLKGVIPIFPTTMGISDGAASSFMLVRGDYITSLDHLYMGGPKDVVRHEIYHLLGCPDYYGPKDECYRIIDKIKEAREIYSKVNPKEDFFPGCNHKSGGVYLTRESVNKRLEGGRKYLLNKKRK